MMGACDAQVFAGNWCWENVAEDSKFPEGFHNPKLAKHSSLTQRWFFATPQISWERPLLEYFFGNMARGGMSLSATWEVYGGLWMPSLHGSMYASREHFIKKLCMVMLVWASVHLFLDSDINLENFLWHLRPHHVSTDFTSLLLEVSCTGGLCD